ncbi:hypothetical protein E4U21_007200 [Claviceps maximensis]|nr:hypothetical protein E4U21_007200 [Claviceps maximensis]
MKFTTILGSLALSALQAHASPVSPADVSPVHQLEARDGYCCVRLTSTHSDFAKYVPRADDPYVWPVFDKCWVVMQRHANGCDGWTMRTVGCDGVTNLKVGVAPANQC